MKSAIAFITQVTYEEDGTYEVKKFTESTTIGKKGAYPSAADFIRALQKMYTEHNRSSKTNKFTISNVVIG